MANMVLTTDYLTNFDPEKYIDQYYTYKKDESGNEICLSISVFDRLHTAFSKGILRGRHIIDIGSGPCISSVIPACRYFEEIYLSDFVPQNRMMLEKWWKGEMTYMQSIIKYYVDAEKNSQTIEERNEELRQKVKDVLAIDVTKPHPLGSESKVEFDALLSCLCLEAAGTDILSYTSCLRNVRSLLKTGGHIILVGVLDQTYYEFGGKRFASAKLSRKDIEAILQEVGFRLVTFDASSFDLLEKADCSSVFFVIAQKCENDFQ